MRKKSSEFGADSVVDPSGVAACAETIESAAKLLRAEGPGSGDVMSESPETPPVSVIASCAITEGNTRRGRGRPPKPSATAAPKPSATAAPKPSATAAPKQIGVDKGRVAAKVRAAAVVKADASVEVSSASRFRWRLS